MTLTRDSHGHIIGVEKAPRTCEWCGAPISGRTKRARYCAGTLCSRHHRKRKRREAVWLTRPNCLVCGERMVPKPSRRLDARTCSRACSRKAWHWFGSMSS
jgi:hypothetical protein